jgi:hypothetical protein
MTFGLVVDPTPKMPIQAARSRPPSSVNRRLHTSATGPQNLQTETVATSGTSPSPSYIGDDRTGAKPWWNKPEGTGRLKLLTTALFMRGPSKVAFLGGTGNAPYGPTCLDALPWRIAELLLERRYQTKPEAERVFPSHQDVGRFGGATGNATAVGLASMFLPPGYQRDCACAYSLTRARPGSYRDRIKPSVCATPAPAVSDTPRPLWGRGVPRLPPHHPSGNIRAAEKETMR